MKVCIPAAEGNGLQSHPFGHFGSAPYFVVHDLSSSTTEVLDNGNQHHAHGGCQPLAALEGRNVDAIIVGGIGVRAIGKLNASGVRVYRAQEGTIADNIQALKSGTLVEMTPDAGCSQHGGCEH